MIRSVVYARRSATDFAVAGSDVNLSPMFPMNKIRETEYVVSVIVSKASVS